MYRKESSFRMLTILYWNSSLTAAQTLVGFFFLCFVHVGCFNLTAFFSIFCYMSVLNCPFVLINELTWFKRCSFCICRLSYLFTWTCLMIGKSNFLILSDIIKKDSLLLEINTLKKMYHNTGHDQIFLFLVWRGLGLCELIH